MFRSQSWRWVLAPLLCSSIVMSATPSTAYLENITPKERQTLTQQSTQSWQTFRSSTHNFQISMPGQPVQHPISDQNLPAQLYMQGLKTSPQHIETYGVAIAEISDSIPSQQMTNRILSACSRQTEPGTQVTRTQGISLQSHPGIEVEAQDPDGTLQLSRCYVVGQRFYMLVARSAPVKSPTQFQPTANPESQQTPTMVQFLNSFQVLDLI